MPENSIPTIVVLLPGTTGSALKELQTLDLVIPPPVWPTQVELAVAAHDLARASHLLQMPGADQQNPPVGTTLVPSRPVEGPLNDTGYEPLLAKLAKQLSAQIYIWNHKNDQVPGPASTNAPGNLVVAFGYDWRADNDWQGTQLLALLENITAQWGSIETYQVVLLAHSMGGLVARSYLEDPGKYSASHKVSALITMGTPHLGAPMALAAIVGDKLFPSLPTSLIDTVIDNVDFPSTYQLLPPPNNPVTLPDGSAGGGFVLQGTTVESIYPNSVLYNTLVSQFGASAQNFGSAASFFKLLGNAPDGVQYYVAYGTFSGSLTSGASAGTPTTLSWNGETDSDATITPNYTLPASNNIWSGGDGIVPVWSAMFAGNKSVVAAEVANCSHLQMPTNTAMWTQIQKWLETLVTPSLQASLAEPA